jgi:hypothetical protein
MRIIVIEGRFSYSEYNEAEKLIFFFLRYTNEILLPNLDLRLYRTPELTFALEPREEACRSSMSDRLTRSRARNEAGNSQQPQPSPFLAARRRIMRSGTQRSRCSGSHPGTSQARITPRGHEARGSRWQDTYDVVWMR